MQPITHKLDGSTWDDGPLAEQLIADGAQEITRPDSWQPGLVALRERSFAPGTALVTVEAKDFNEVAKPTGAPVRWFIYPGPEVVAPLELLHAP